MRSLITYATRIGGALLMAGWPGFSFIAAAAETCAANTPSKVEMQLSWVPYTGNIANLVAREKGFFRDVGIDLNIIPGAGSGTTATNVAQGTVMFGESDIQSIIVNRSKGQKVKIIALLTDGTSQAFGTLDPAIKTPKDFEGRSVGVGLGTGDRLLLPVLVKANGGDVSKVNLMNIAPAVYATSLLNGQVDVAPSYLDGSYVSNSRLAKMQGKTLYVVPSSAHNLDIYRQVLIAADRTIGDNACLARAFTQATLKGLRYAVEHRDESIKIMLAAVPTVNPTDVPLQLEQLAKLIDTPGFKTNGYGVADPKKLEETLRTILEAYDIRDNVTVADIYDGTFAK